MLLLLFCLLLFVTIVVAVFCVVCLAISVATFTSARQITAQHVAIKITARQLSPLHCQAHKNVARVRSSSNCCCSCTVAVVVAIGVAVVAVTVAVVIGFYWPN